MMGELVNAKERVTTVRLPEEMFEQVEQAARIDGVSVSKFVRRAIRDWCSGRMADERFAGQLRDRIAADQASLDQILARLDRADRIGATVADECEALALQIEDGAPDLDIDTIWQITRYLTACGYVSLARHDADIAEVVATWQATLDKTVDEANRQLAAAKAAGAAEVVARVEAVADEWDGGEPNGVSHVVACKSYNCPDCAVIACAADLRAALTTGGEGCE